MLTRTVECETVVQKRNNLNVKKDTFKVKNVDGASSDMVDASLPTLTAVPSPPPASSENHKPPKKKVSFREPNLVDVFEFENDVKSKAGCQKYRKWCTWNCFRFKESADNLDPLLTPILTSDRHDRIHKREMTASDNAMTSTTIVSATIHNYNPCPPSPKWVRPPPSAPIPIPGGQRRRLWDSEIDDVFAIWGEVKLG